VRGRERERERERERCPMVLFLIYFYFFLIFITTYSLYGGEDSFIVPIPNSLTLSRPSNTVFSTHFS
jgi:hypothetical protein